MQTKPNHTTIFIMNLWAKSVGRLAISAVALFFFSCEDETSYIGFKNPQPKFNVSFIDIPLESSVMLVDSVITDNAPTDYGGVGRNVIGEYNDPFVGSVRAESYLRMTPASTAKLDGSVVYDSLTFQMRLNFYSYGFSGEQEMTFKIHEITGSKLDLDSLRKRYYYNSTVQYNPQPLGLARVVVNYDSLKKESAKSEKQDTILLLGKLDDELGRRLFNLALTDDGSKFSNPELFAQEIKGLVITPTQSNGILGILAQSAFSKVVMHYHSMENGAVADTLQKAFVFNASAVNPNFTNYTTNRSGTELAMLTQSYQSFKPPSGLRVVQSGSPVITKLDLTKFYAVADTIENVLVNAAELIISNVGSASPTDVHRSLLIKVINNNSNLFASNQVSTDRQSLSPYFIFPAQEGHYYVASDLSTGTQLREAALQYNSENSKLSTFLTLFVQGLFANKKVNNEINPNRISALALYPGNPGAGAGVNRTVFNANDIKLRIYYTKAVTNLNSN